MVNDEIQVLTVNKLYSLNVKLNKWEINDEVGLCKRKIDYLAGMTDGYAIQEYKKLK